MPWLKVNKVWYEVPEGTQPLGDEELVYEKPDDDEDVLPLAVALAAGLLLWGWDTDTARYTLVSEGDPVGTLSALGTTLYSRQSIQASSLATDFLASFYADGTLPANQWYQLMRQEIKDEFIRQALLGRGGRAQMLARDWGRVGAQLKRQYQHLDRFYGQLDQLSEAQIRSRSRMYIRAAGQAYQRMRDQVALDWGADEELWVVNHMLENCDDCLGFEDESWQPIGYFPIPRDGSTVCLTNCGCHKIYRNSKTGNIWEG